MDITEIDLKCMLRFFKKLRDTGDQPLKFSDGVLSTQGCVGDYGCCAEVIHIDDAIEALESLVGEVNQ